jgi:hypothetical protein
MNSNGYILLAIYFISILTLAVSVYSVWLIIKVEEQITNFYDKTVKSILELRR